ncbi:MAG: hypothetical protein NTY12_03035 [Candidatus Falkowbacteria bacterium]|nr:hypothetical protein [Candidatus Falkowbacteria bacterium]
MTPKELIINFLYLAFLVLLVGGAILFFIQGNRFSEFAIFLRSAWPIAFLLAVLAFKLQLTNNEKKRGESNGMDLRTLNLTFADKMKAELVVFACPLSILLVAALSDTGVDALDIIQALVVLAIVYAWHKYLWLRAR